jgi:3',5'-cyclic AMP phosphodiesterase CpdA
MTENKQIDRRGFLKCMQWVGAGVVWSFAGGVPTSRLLGDTAADGVGDFHFVQISDTHIGFNRPANADVTGTLEAVIAKINGLADQPDLILHTGDLTHQAKAYEFDTLAQRLKSLRQSNVFHVPGEHDFSGGNGRLFLERFGKGSAGQGWMSFQYRGVHFVGLNNSLQLEGLGNIGAEQMEWLAKDLDGLGSSTPVVVFAHIPLWALYPKWGWGTKDSAQALALLKRFGSVTVLNGHIHQVMQKLEGNVTFHTAMSTAFPQAAPGAAEGPGPLKVPDDQLRRVLGIAEVNFVAGSHELAVVDSPLG